MFAASVFFSNLAKSIHDHNVSMLSDNLIIKISDCSAACSLYPNSLISSSRSVVGQDLGEIAHSSTIHAPLSGQKQKLITVLAQYNTPHSDYSAKSQI